MSLLHDHHHHHDHDDAEPSAATLDGRRQPRGWLVRNLRFIVAGLLLGAIILSAVLTLVEPGQAVVFTRFGDPVRVATAPGLAWRLPPPLESTIPVDLRLRTTSNGLQDVGTRDGLRVIVQAYVAWQVPGDGEHIDRFLRAVRNQPDEAAEQLRSFLGSSVEITASSFDLASLVNTDPAKIRLDDFERQLAARLEEQVLKVYGVTVRQVGIERLTLPTQTLLATVNRMRADRQTMAVERMAAGERTAAEIRSNADRDARITIAKARTEGAQIDARARSEAAEIYARAYSSDPNLYGLVRSLDTLDGVLNPNTRLILRTDAAPFRILVDGPNGGTSGLPEQAGRAP
jgi:modulator of FtsH protease HflC